MTNKVGGSGLDNVSAQIASDRAVKRTKDASGVATATQTQDTATTDGNSGVQITQSARQLAALEQAIRDVPAVDEQKVSKVSAAIAQGNYTVSPERIADKLIRMEKDLSK